MAITAMGAAAKKRAGQGEKTDPLDDAAAMCRVLAAFFEAGWSGGSDKAKAVAAFRRMARNLNMYAAAHGLSALRADCLFEASRKQDALEITICRECGCSHYDPCKGGCSWVSEELCSACVEISQGIASKKARAAK
jgi:hypothetical protein